MRYCSIGCRMKSIYCFCADYKEGPPAAKRSAISATWDTHTSDCGWTLVDFGEEERYLLVYVLAESLETASEQLRTFLDAQGWKAVPFPIDWTKGQVLVTKLYSITDMANLIAAKFENPDQIDFGQIKSEIGRKIGQNLKWNRRFEQLMKDIGQYQRRPNQRLFVRIMDQCAALHVLPQHRSNGA
jgi:hypothetical protein